MKVVFNYHNQTYYHALSQWSWDDWISRQIPLLSHYHDIIQLDNDETPPFYNIDPDEMDNIFEAVTTECVQVWERDGEQVGKEAHSGSRKAKREAGRPKSTHTGTFGIKKSKN